MTYVDKLLRVSSAQAPTATAVSTDSVDLGVARDIGEGVKVTAFFTVPTLVTSGGTPTVTFEIIGADAANLTGNVLVLGSSAAFAHTTLTAGRDPIAVEMNPQIASTGRRYLGVRYTIAGGTLTGGAFTADLVLDIQDGKKFYASGIAVS